MPTITAIADAACAELDVLARYLDFCYELNKPRGGQAPGVGVGYCPTLTQFSAFVPNNCVRVVRKSLRLVDKAWHTDLLTENGSYPNGQLSTQLERGAIYSMQFYSRHCFVNYGCGPVTLVNTAHE